MDVGIQRTEHEVEPCPPAQWSSLEDGRHLIPVAIPPGTRVQLQPGGPGSSSRSILQTHPFSTSGGITPGWPSGIGDGPKVTFEVSMNRTPAASTRTAKR